MSKSLAASGSKWLDHAKLDLDKCDDECPCGCLLRNYTNCTRIIIN